MDTVYLLGEAVGMDTNMGEVWARYWGMEIRGEAFWMAFICR